MEPLPERGRFGWLVGFGFNGPLRQYFSIYRAVSQREGERRERIDESKNVQTTPNGTYYKCNRPLPYCNQNCRTPRHWKFTQHHRTTRPSPREREKKERIDECKNVQTTPTRTYCERSRPWPYCIQIVGRPGTGSLPSTIAPPNHPHPPMR